MSKSNTKPSLTERVLYEDNHLIIVNKMAGELVQGDRTADTTLAERTKDYIKVNEHKPGKVFLGIPHRLDRPVSGIVIYAKSSKGLSRMSEVFRSRSIQKTYWAIVEHAPAKPKGQLVGWMKKNEAQNKSYVIHEEQTGYKKAILSYQLLHSSERYHLLEVVLETGRHHQIRAQLADMGCVIKGDLKYGGKRSNADASISLHARSIHFEHPVKKTQISIVAPCPQEALWQYFENAVQ